MENGVTISPLPSIRRKTPAPRHCAEWDRLSRSKKPMPDVDRGCGMIPPSHRSGSRRCCARELLLPNTRRLPSIRPCDRSSDAQMHDLAWADQPWMARSMDGFIERGAGGEGYSECWLKPTPLRARRRRHDGLSEGTLHVEDATIAQQVVAGACTCGRTSAGSADCAARRSGPPRSMPRRDTCCHICGCLAPSSCRWRHARS